eukprot:CAMPEP_0202702888 /NCGR_PEP_ID=MMETSP1385-20130828/15812_1 /ASSEMBLY_ACC=CAM_ASM_000861 /TAXON_ID=933848 /ORGANISM="Elphidium margaritaceum" /LENGTH=175 /DNA_ID=CAMNT_0049360635 /DNA_START=38 /DNA_END=562 /DNA_ORIENTATION=-
MAALSHVIYGDCREVCDTLSSFLKSDEEEIEAAAGQSSHNAVLESCGYDPALFLDQEQIQHYLCAICQHVVKDAVEIGCGHRHIFCHGCTVAYYDLMYEDVDNNYVYYGVENDDWSWSSNPEVWHPNKCRARTAIKCPLCKSKVDKKEFKKLGQIDEKILNALFVQCDNSDACQW